MDIFDILATSGFYREPRRIALYSIGDETNFEAVSTVECPDCEGFETAIYHPLYNNHAAMVVESYDTEEEAKLGHERWVAQIDNLPLKLVTDCRSPVACPHVFYRAGISAN